MNNEKWWESSSGNGDLSLTIKGLLLALVPLSVTALQHFGYTASQDQLAEVVNVFTAIVSAAVILTGLIRKIANRIT